jgi:hypothetical protein
MPLRQKIGTAFGDLLCISVLFAAGYFLIGYYLSYNYLATGYQDWIYHAFRVKSIQNYGLVPWDSIWSNGIAYWRGYQYVIHYLILFVVNLWGLSITQSMMAWTVGVYIGVRILTFIVLRVLHVPLFSAFFASLVSYDFAQQWVTIKDFSIHIASIVIPLLVLVWIRALTNVYYLYFFAALTGVSWLLHPIIGYSFTGLFVLALFVRRPVSVRFHRLGSIALFICTFLPFPAQYFLTGYSFANPIFSSSQFLKDTILPDNIGLSLIYLLLCGVGWCVLFLFADRVPRWSKLLLLFCSVYMLVIWIGINGYLPGFLNSLQISRAITVVGLLLPFSFASLLSTPLRMSHSKLVPSILVVVMAVSIANSIELSSQYSGQPVNSLVNPVAYYLKDKKPVGSVYYEDVSEASYFSPSYVRFVSSYNEHREGHPLAQRFRNLMHSDAAYTGVTQKQIDLINAYSRVLGVEYIFLPELSPLVDGLTSDLTKSIYKNTVRITTKRGVFTVLHNTEPIHYAYTVDASIGKQIKFSLLSKPTLYADSFKAWDEEVLKTSQLIEKGLLTPVSLSFPSTNTLALSQIPPGTQDVLVMQTYDDYWSATRGVRIAPTSLRMMFLRSDTFSSKILLHNEWPNWHWPLQLFSVVLCILSCVIALIFGRRRSYEQTVTV